MAGDGHRAPARPRRRSSCGPRTSSWSSRSGAPASRSTPSPGISLDVKEGETLGLVGESGCGKSTTGRALMQFPCPTSGPVTFEGEDLTAKHGEDLRGVRTRMQMIFQDPISSLNPRRKVGDIVAEALAIWASRRTSKRSATTTVAAAISSR